MDCTGSMGSFISAAKEKILEIITKVEGIFNLIIVEGEGERGEKKGTCNKLCTRIFLQ
jgi:hypothetical protein